MEIKTGIKTTEFWLTVAVFIAGWIEQALNINLPKESLYGIIGYVLTRGWIKANGK